MGVYTLGIDIGTSSVKAGLLEPESGCLEYISQRSYDNAAHQDTGVIWEKTLEVLEDMGASLSEGQRIAAVGLSGQMHGTVMYDKHGRIIGPLINWQDKSCDQPLTKYNGKTTIDVLDMYRYMHASRNGFADAFEKYMGMRVQYYEDHFWDLITDFLD